MATSIGTDISASNTAAGSAPAGTAGGDMLVCLPPLMDEAREAVLTTVLAAFPGDSLLIATAEPDASTSQGGTGRLVPYEDARGHSGWALTAADYLAAGNLARKHRKENVLLVGTEMPSVELLKSLALDISSGHADVVLPRPKAGLHDGLVNAGLIYPLTRALFGQDIRFPLPHDIGLSQRALERFASEAQREVSAGKSESFLWPISIAAAAGFSIRQVNTDEHIPVPPVPDFNRLFTEVIGSLFSDAEARAMVWQRGRYSTQPPSTQIAAVLAAPDASPEVTSMIEGFRVAYANLLPIWSLVLPPRSLLALKKLAAAASQAFLVPPELWARIVYDFALAFHLRTLNRNHLVGALIPLYRAWAASQIGASAGDSAEAERLIGLTASAFESEKPYFVSRWRWPDRFNP